MLTVLGGKKLLVIVCLLGLFSGSMQAADANNDSQQKEKELNSLRWYTYGAGAACAAATALFTGIVLYDWFGVNKHRRYPLHSILVGAIMYGGGLGCGAVGVYNGCGLFGHEKAILADKIISAPIIANGAAWWLLAIGGMIFSTQSSH